MAAGIGFSHRPCGEIARGGWYAAYDPCLAQMRADRSARRPKARKLDANPQARTCALERLRLCRLPAKISEAMRRGFPDDKEMGGVSHEAIYQTLYA